MSSRTKLSELIEKKQKVNDILTHIKDIDTCIKNRKDFPINKLKEINDTFGLKINFSKKNKDKLCEEVIDALKKISSQTEKIEEKVVQTVEDKKIVEKVEDKKIVEKVEDKKIVEKVEKKVSKEKDDTYLNKLKEELSGVNCKEKGGEWTLARFKELAKELRTKYKLDFTLSSNAKKEIYCETLKNAIDRATSVDKVERKVSEEKAERKVSEKVERKESEKVERKESEKVERKESEKEKIDTKEEKVDEKEYTYFTELDKELKGVNCKDRGGKWTLARFKDLVKELRTKYKLEFTLSSNSKKEDYCETIKNTIEKVVRKMKKSVERKVSEEKAERKVSEQKVERKISEEKLERKVSEQKVNEPLLKQLLFDLKKIKSRFETMENFTTIDLDFKVDTEGEINKVETLIKEVEKLDFADAIEYIKKYNKFVNDKIIGYLYRIILKIGRKDALANLRFFTYKYLNLFENVRRKLYEEDTVEFLIHLFDTLKNSSDMFEMKNIIYKSYCEGEENKNLQEKEQIVLETVYPLSKKTEKQEDYKSIQESLNDSKVEVLEGNRRCKEGELFYKVHKLILNDYALFRINLFDVQLTKNKTKININTEITNDNDTYELIGVINHIGNDIKRGHYIAYIKKEQKWYECDDKDVEELKDYEKINGKKDSNPYVLLYKNKNKTQNISEPPFGLENVTRTACYMNSALQVLFNTNFYNFILNKGKESEIIQREIEEYKLKKEERRLAKEQVEEEMKALEEEERSIQEEEEMEALDKEEKRIQAEREREALDKEEERRIQEEEKMKALDKEEKRIQAEQEMKELEFKKQPKYVKVPKKADVSKEVDYLKKVISNIKRLKEVSNIEEAVSNIDEKILSCIGLAV